VTKSGEKCGRLVRRTANTALSVRCLGYNTQRLFQGWSPKGKGGCYLDLWAIFDARDAAEAFVLATMSHSGTERFFISQLTATAETRTRL